MAKKIVAGAAAALGVLAAVLGINTARLMPPAGAGDARAAPVPAFDGDAAAQRLGAAIRFRTVSNQNSADNQLDQWQGFQAWLQTAYPAAHKAMARTLAENGTLIYKWQGSDPAAKAIILMAHQDVVPVTPGTEKDWKYPPFAGTVAQGAVWGRGAIDDKGSLIGLFEALDVLARNGFKPRRTIWIVSGHDEEAGGTGAKAAAAWMKAEGVSALFTIDEGSAIIEDAPVVKGPAIMIGVAEKGYATLKVTAKAVGGHSSMPPGEIATVNLAKAVVAIHGRQFERALRQPVLGTVEALAAHKGGAIKIAAANPWLFGGMIKSRFGQNPSGAAALHTTIAPTMLQGSPKENVLPQSASALINYRIAPWNSSRDVMERAKSAVGKLPVTLSWDRAPREPSPVSSTSSEGWRWIAAAAAPEAPGAPVAPYLVVGGTDSRNFTGISKDVYRFAAVRLKTEETAMIHGTNEHLRVDDLARMIRFYLRLIASAAG